MSTQRIAKMLQGSAMFRQEWAAHKQKIGYGGLTPAAKKLAYAQFRAHRNAQRGKSNSARLIATLQSSRVGSGVYQVRKPVYQKGVPRKSVNASVAALARKLKRFGINAQTVAEMEQSDPTVRKLIDIYKNSAYSQYPQEIKKRAPRKKKPVEEKKAPKKKTQTKRKAPKKKTQTKRKAPKKKTQTKKKAQLPAAGVRRKRRTVKRSPRRARGGILAGDGGILAGEGGQFY